MITSIDSSDKGDTIRVAIIYYALSAIIVAGAVAMGIFGSMAGAIVFGVFGALLLAAAIYVTIRIEAKENILAANEACPNYTGA